MDNSPQARTGQVEVPNVGSIQSGTPQLYQQSSGIQSTNSQLLNGVSNAQILIPSGEPNSPSSGRIQNSISTTSSNLGWIFVLAAVLIVGVIIAIIGSRKRSASNTVEEKTEREQGQHPVAVKNSSTKSKSKSKNRKKTKKKKK